MLARGFFLADGFRVVPAIGAGRLIHARWREIVDGPRWLVTPSSDGSSSAHRELVDPCGPLTKVSIHRILRSLALRSTQPLPTHAVPESFAPRY